MFHFVDVPAGVVTEWSPAGSDLTVWNVQPAASSSFGASRRRAAATRTEQRVAERRRDDDEACDAASMITRRAVRAAGRRRGHLDVDFFLGLRRGLGRESVGIREMRSRSARAASGSVRWQDYRELPSWP